jgi:uncharacterized membrane protein YvlD (DUF360 family)
MRKLLILAAIFFGSAVVGMLLAGLFVPGMGVGLSGFAVAVVVFTLAQSLLTPLITRIARRFSPPLVGGVGVLSTGVALSIAGSFPGGITLQSPTAWILATLIVWLVTALGSWLLPLWLLKKTVRKMRNR